MLDAKKVPFVAILRQRFDAAREAFDKAIREFNVVILKKCCPSSLLVDSGKCMSIDILPFSVFDVPPFDNSGNKKEGVSWIYKKHDGYSSKFAYAGLEGYVANCELSGLKYK